MLAIFRKRASKFSDELEALKKQEDALIEGLLLTSIRYADSSASSMKRWTAQLVIDKILWKDH